MKKTPLITFVITAFAFVLGIFLFQRMPATMATHWGIDGNVNGYMPRFWGTFLMPFLMGFLWILFLVIPSLDPRRGNIEKFRPAFDSFILLMFMFLEYIYLISLAWNLGYRFDFLRAVLPTFAILYYGMGDLVEAAEPNCTVGIRLPWTLKNDTVWKKTHRVGGKLFKYSALVAAGTLFFPEYGIYLVMAPLLATVLITGFYSFLIYRKITA